MPLRLIIEGLTGAGKTSMIQAICQKSQAQGNTVQVLWEEETFGELMAELQEKRATEEAYCWRLKQVLNNLPAQLVVHPFLILERFHLSYYAQLPIWEHYRAYDLHLAQLGFRLVLLDYPPESLTQRALYRVDRQDSDWAAGNIAWYGSATEALAAFQLSQQRRHEALQLTKLPYTVINTEKRNWELLADQLLSGC